jgi:cyanate lyase
MRYEKHTAFVEPMMDKDDVAAMILAKKKQSGMTWEEIAAAIGLSPVFAHSAALGMNSMPTEPAEALVKLLGLPQEAAVVLGECPTKVWNQAVPTDPCIYRL